MTNSTLNKSFIALALFISGLSFAQTAEERAEITETYSAESTTTLTKYIETYTNQQKAEVRNFIKAGYPEFKTNADGSVSQLMGAFASGDPLYYTSENNELAATLTGARYLNTGGGLGQDINGEGMLSFHWDSGYPRSSHQEFTGKIIIGDFETPTAAQNNHASHTAGTIIAKGVNAIAKGLAPMGTIKAYRWTDDISELYTEANGGALFSNQSYGATTSGVASWVVGTYTSNSYNYDNITDARSFYLPVFSAGNHGANTSANSEPLGGDGNYDQLVGRKVAKNTLTVAWGVPNTSVASGFTISNQSAAGPSDDLRIKPDITGIGQNITSVSADSDTAYWSASGSSIASPTVTGNILLLQQYHKALKGSYMFNFQAKGVVLHTATDDVAQSGPDSHSGWGLINAQKAADAIKNDGTTTVSEPFTLNDGASHEYRVVSDGTKPLLVSISWTDVAQLDDRYDGSDTGGVPQANYLKPVLNNDLDVVVTKDGVTYYPWRLTSPTTNANNATNDRDNFERVDIYNPTAGIYTITVSHKGNLLNNPRNSTLSEDYALNVTGITERLLSVDEFELSNLSIYPNPANNAVNIAFNNNKPSNDVTITVTDILGKVVLNKIYKSGGKDFKQQVNIDQLQSGIYLLAVNNGNSSLTKKLVKN